MNFSATFNVFRLIRDPALCMPHATVPNFNHLPIPLSKSFLFSERGYEPDIRAVVLDKDNCFAKPKDNVIHESYIDKFTALRTAYPGSKLLIVSNSAGTYNDRESCEAQQLQAATGVTVFKHHTKKPGCGSEVLEFLRNAPNSEVTKASQIAVVGDRLFTDVMMANMMGSWSIWLEDGVIQKKTFFMEVESRLASFLSGKRFRPQVPSFDD